MSTFACRGFTLVELMIASAIGITLVAAALSLFGQGRAVARVNETVARIQEQGRYALSTIEADAEIAGFYGFTNWPAAIRLVSGGNPDSVVATAAQMTQASIAAAGVPASAQACGVNFAVDVLTPVQGSNGVFTLGRSRTAACAPYGSGVVAGADTLTLRHADTRDAAAEAGRIQLLASRLSSRTAQYLFADGNAPGGVDSNHRLLNLVVRTYYIARDSVSRPGFPALRVKALSRSGGSAVFDEDEVITGIEDLQVQFGIDTGDRDNDGRIDADADADGDGLPDASGRVTRYVSSDFPDLGRYPVLAVRVWLRVRADEPETGYIDGRTYRYADVVYTPSGADAAYRRVVVTRTIAVRNARLY